MTNKVARIKVDLSEWDMWDWGKAIGKLVKVDRDGSSIEIRLELDGEHYKEAARKIATEAIELFLDGISASVAFTPEGMKVSVHSEEPQKVVVEWGQLLVDGDPASFKAAQEWLDEEFEAALEDIAEEDIAAFKRDSGR